MSKIAFVFPGQGAQFVGMGKDLYENNSEAKKIYDEIFEKLEINLKEVMFSGPEATLKETLYTQPAIVTLSTILAALVEAKGIKADYVAGHSVGEYAALTSAGYLSLVDGVKLTALRGKVMDKIAKEVNGTMAAIIGCERDVIVNELKAIDEVVEAVNFNEPKQTVIAGSIKGVEVACEVLSQAGAKRAIPLSVSGPFHSSLMKPAGETLKTELENFAFLEPTKILVANTTAKDIDNKEALKEELVSQAFGPVEWVKTIEHLKAQGVETIYEIGPGRVLKGLIRKIDKSIKVINVQNLDDLNNL